MKACEKDVDIKIPKWYMKLPVSILEKICAVVMILSKSLPVRKRKKNTGNIRFYI